MPQIAAAHGARNWLFGNLQFISMGHSRQSSQYRKPRRLWIHPLYAQFRNCEANQGRVPRPTGLHALRARPPFSAQVRVQRICMVRSITSMATASPANT